MIRPGIVSITFRKLTPGAIIRLAKGCGLLAIEWGGDVHVPHGDLKAADRVRRMSADAGIDTVSYGSYYRAGGSEADGTTFASVIKTAKSLESPCIRVWAGPTNPQGPEAPQDNELFNVVAEDLRRIGKMAADAGMKIGVEYHPHTYTADADSATRLMRAVDHPEVKLYWQPNPYHDDATNIASLNLVLPHLIHVHVFNWSQNADGEVVRHPFSSGLSIWKSYFGAIQNKGVDCCAMLEFVKGDSAEQLQTDGASLTALLNEVSPNV